MRLWICALALGLGSAVWAMCAVFVSQDPTQIVAAVGFLALSAIAGTALFVLSVSRAILPVAARAPVATVAVDRFVHAHIALGSSPPKLALFVAD